MAAYTLPQLGGHAMLANQGIRKAAKTAGVRLWEVARALDISDNTLTRRLREELPEADQRKILAIIDRIGTARKAVG